MSMSFTLTEEQQAICDEVAKLCAPFDDDYWLEHDRSAEFPFDFHRAVAEGGWLGIAESPGQFELEAAAEFPEIDIFSSDGDDGMVEDGDDDDDLPEADALFEPRPSDGNGLFTQGLEDADDGFGQEYETPSLLDGEPGGGPTETASEGNADTLGPDAWLTEDGEKE